MKVNYGKAIQVNNELKVNLDEQQEDIKHLKEQCDIENEDEVQDIAAIITIIKKEKANGEKKPTKKELKKHIKEENIELW